MINVNTVYKSVLSILNKEQRGYLTPDEFNKQAKIAQMNLLEIAFAEYNKFLSMDTLGRVNAGYADLPERIKEKIDIFYKTTNLSGSKLPSDVYKLIDLNMLDKTVSLEEIDKNELAYILSSPLTKPSKDFPIYYKTTTALGETSIIVKPTITDTISVDYIKIPTAPRFGYTVNSTYGTNIYDSNIYVADGLIIASDGLTSRTTISSGATNGTYTGTVGTTTGFTGSGTGTIVVTVAGNAVTNVEITGSGAGHTVGSTITVASSVIGGSTNLVITIGANDLYSGNTTQGSTNFELHPSEENSLIMSILGLAGVTIKDQGLVTLTSRALQAQAQLKSQ